MQDTHASERNIIQRFCYFFGAIWEILKSNIPFHLSYMLFMFIEISFLLSLNMSFFLKHKCSSYLSSSIIYLVTKEYSLLMRRK